MTVLLKGEVHSNANTRKHVEGRWLTNHNRTYLRYKVIKRQPHESYSSSVHRHKGRRQINIIRAIELWARVGPEPATLE